MIDRSNHRRHYYNFYNFHSRSLVAEDKQTTLAFLRKEYQLYKDQWGLNLRYSREAGESTNYSKMIVYIQIDNIRKLFSAAKIPLELQVVHIFFDSSTYDKVEKDAKVKFKSQSLIISTEGALRRLMIYDNPIPSIRPSKI